MIKSNNTKSSRTLILLLMSFAMLLFITACGGDLEDGTGGTSSGGSISISSTLTSLAAGESSIITSTVTDGLGAPAQGKTVTFTLLNNNSGATITVLNGGYTDAKGQAIATYTAGANSPTTSLQDMIQASASGATAAATITRISSGTASTGFRMTLTADSTSLAAGQSTIVKATITDGSGSPASGQAVSFTLLNNNSGATLTILSLGVTDNSGQALAIYKSGINSPTTSVQDMIQASVTGAVGVIMITRLSSSATSTGLIMTLTADTTSLAAGQSTLIRAAVTDGSGAPSAGQVVTFTLLGNQSGATLVPLNGGATDASGQAIATYTAGANSPTLSVQDTIQASVTGTTGAVIITRVSSSTTLSGLRLILTAAATSLAAGQSTIITAKVTNGSGTAVQGEFVTFTFMPGGNPSGASLNGVATPVTVTTNAAGEATVLYTSGFLAAATVQDIVRASITGSTEAIIITKTSTGLRMTLTANATSLSAGQSTIVTATLIDGSGAPAVGQALTFTLLNNNSGATLTILSLGVTDSSGQAQAIYKAGANSPTLSVQDTIQASVTGAIGAVIITRLSSSASLVGFRMSLTADSTSLSAGGSTIIRATVTDGSGVPSAEQTVAFTLLSDHSGATLSPLNGGVTDVSGQAIATFTAGANSPTTSVQDTIQASVTGTTGAVIITRISSSATLSGLHMVLTAAPTSLAAGESTVITAKVTSGSGSAVQGESVTFTFMPGGNPSGTSLNGGVPLPVTILTDAAGEATVLYTAGSLTAATVQDIVQASITGSTKAVIITKTGTSTGVTAASLDISASPLSIKTDGSTTSTITVNALNALNAALSGIVVTMGTDTGVLSAPTLTTPGTVTLSCGSNKANRTATVTATAGAVTVQIPIQITGSTVTLTSGSTTIPNDGVTTMTLTATVKDAGGNGISGQTVSLTQTGTGSVTFGALSGTTNASGIFTTTAKGTTNGSVTITATWLGTTSSKDITVTSTAAAFGIDQQRLDTGSGYVVVPGNPDPTAMHITTDKLEIRVNVPAPTTSVTFATTIGEWDGGALKTVTKSGLTPPTTVTAVLTTSYIGMANVEVSDTSVPATKDTLAVAMSSGAAPAKIFLQASPTAVSISTGSTTGTSTVTATVYDASNNPLGEKPVAFEIVDGTSTSGGETISPVTGWTRLIATSGLSVGQVRTTFTSGSMPSSSTGVKIRASVIGYPAVVTGTAPSGNDAAIVIGGVSGSIAFGQASTVTTDDTQANYIWPLSVVVADSNGNPVQGAVVTLGVVPIAWCTGILCSCDLDTATTGTFWSEDRNENLILDGKWPDLLTGEDGWRCYYADKTKCPGAPGTVALNGDKNNLLTPTNSVAGTVPATVTTDANGVAGFNLTYPKSSARWVWDRVRATTIVQGSETRAEIILHLNIANGDEPICNESPFLF